MTISSVRPAAVLVALALGASGALAQNPAARPAPPAPQPVAAPAPLRPTTAPPPPAPSAAPSAASAPVAAAPVRPMTRPGLPPDSVRPAAPPPPMQVPAGAAAQCRDGTFVADPAACSTRRGVVARFPAGQAPSVPRPASPDPSALRAATPATPAAPPAGATMRCKDGTYLYGTPAEGRCSLNGGLAAVMAPERPAPPPPARQRRP